MLNKNISELTEVEVKQICNAILNRFQIEYRHDDRNGIYGFSQRTLAYNSNKVEGSKLTKEQTQQLFDTKTITTHGDELYTSKDIEEMTGHFMMFNNMLKTMHEPLSIDLIKSYHRDLKAGVFEDRANGYAIGDWKTRANVVGEIITTKPSEVQNKMDALLQWYHSQKVNLPVLTRLHAEFEKIHPFQDGNGRVGRLMLFRECLRNGVLPFIVRDTVKDVYVKALQLAQLESKYFELELCFRQEQEWFWVYVQNLLCADDF